MIAKRIVLHCSDTDNGKHISAEQIRRWHVAGNGWDDIGYHVVIEVDGRIRKYPDIGRPLNIQGAHVKGENADSLGVCLVGRDKFTAKQFETLWDFYSSTKLTLRIPEYGIYTHNEFDKNKTCPGMRAGDVIYWLTKRDFKPLEKHLIVNTGVSGWKSNAIKEKKGDLMSLMKVEVEVTKEMYELGQGVAGFVESLKTALADGWDTGQDLPAVMSSALAHLVPAVQGVDQLDDEAKADTVAFSKAVALGLADAIGAGLKK